MSSTYTIKPASSSFAFSAPWVARRSALGQREYVLSGMLALQPLPRALRVFFTAWIVTLPAKVTLVSVVVVPEATRTRLRPDEVTATVARWLLLLVFLMFSTLLGQPA